MKKYFSICSLFLLNIVSTQSLYGIEESYDDKLHTAYVYGNFFIEQYKTQSYLTLSQVNAQINDLLTKNKYFEDLLTNDRLLNKMANYFFLKSSINASIRYGYEMMSAQRSFALESFSSILTSSIHSHFHFSLSNVFTQSLDYFAFSNQEQLNSISHSVESHIADTYLTHLDVATKSRILGNHRQFHASPKFTGNLSLAGFYQQQ